MEAELQRDKNQEELIEYSLDDNLYSTGEFDWVGVRSHFPNLRSIFQ